jgi:uncharacterized protein YqgQ
MTEEQVSPIVLQARLERKIPERSRIIQTLYGIPFHFEAEGMRSEFEIRISALEEEVRRLKKESVGYVRVNSLPNKILKSALDVVVEADGDGYIARTVDLSLFGNGDDPIEAIEMLKREIESLYDDLMKGDDFTEDWLKIKRFLVERISD